MPFSLPATLFPGVWLQAGLPPLPGFGDLDWRVPLGGLLVGGLFGRWAVLSFTFFFPCSCHSVYAAFDVTWVLARAVGSHRPLNMSLGGGGACLFAFWIGGFEHLSAGVSDKLGQNSSRRIAAMPNKQH